MHTVRNATESDLSQLKQLALAAWLNAYAGIFTAEEIRAENDKFYTAEFHTLLLKATREGRHLFKVLVSNETIVGLMDFDYDGGNTWLTRFYVAPALIGKGLGKTLLLESEKELRIAGRKDYRLLVHKRNALGINFYERNGFFRNSRYDQEADDEICYEKTL